MAKEVVVSPSLIRTPPPLAELDKEYVAELKEWMGEWFPDDESEAICTSETDKENKEQQEQKVPCKRKKALSLSLNKGKKKALQDANHNDASNDGGNRFATPCSEQEMNKLAEGLKPANTEATTQWAVNNFTKWAANRRALVPDDPVPSDLLVCHDPAIVSKYLCMFVVETRKENGDKYPPATIRALLSGINRTLQDNKVPFGSIFDKESPHFRDLCKTLDVVCSTLHREGVGAKKKHAGVIEADHEQSFWDKGLLGYSSPRVLQRTVFFYVGMYFALRGVEEQYSLVPNQFIRNPQDTATYNTDVYYQYTEFISKNNQHRYKDVQVKNKVVRGYAQVDNDRCIVKLLDCYLARLKPDSSFFYMRPLEKIPKECGKPWYTGQRVGINTLKSFLPQLSMEAGCDVKYTNHSLRATSTTRMFSGGVPEKLIAEKTGHRSLQALRSYERTPSYMEKAIDSVIADPTAGYSCSSESQLPDSETVNKYSTRQANPDKPPTVDAVKPPIVDPVPKPAEHVFSGTLNNCTINISYK